MPALDIARYIVSFFQDAGDPITNLKLQKLLYYVQGWHLALKDAPAFSEDLQAWVHGPVQPNVYQMFKHSRWNPILDDQGNVNIDSNLKKHIDAVLDVYGADGAYSLERRSHSELPWIKARGNLAPDEECQAVISHESMQKFFKKLGEDGEDSKGQ